MKKINSINIKTLLYLITYSVCILFILWIVQILFFKVFYEKYQINNLKGLANELYSTNANEIFTKVESLTFDNNTCLEYIDSNNNHYYYNNRINGCLLGNNNILDKYKYDIKNSSDDIKAVKLINFFYLINYLNQ